MREQPCECRMCPLRRGHRTETWRDSGLCEKHENVIAWERRRTIAESVAS